MFIPLHHKQADLILGLFGENKKRKISRIRERMSFMGYRFEEILLTTGAKIKIEMNSNYVATFALTGYAANGSDVYKIINELPITSGLKLLEKIKS